MTVILKIIIIQSLIHETWSSWNTAFRPGLIHVTTTAARWVTLHLTNEALWSMGSYCHLQPLSHSWKAPHPPLWVQYGHSPEQQEEFTMTHWIIKKKKKPSSVFFMKCPNWFPLRPGRGTATYSKRKSLCFPTPLLPPALLKSSFCCAVFSIK